MLTNFAPMQCVRMPVHVRGMGLAFECMLDLWGEQSSSGRSYTRCPTTDDHLIFLRGGTSWSWASSWSRVNIAESGTGLPLAHLQEQASGEVKK